MAKPEGDAQRWRVEPGTEVHLGEIDTRSTDGAPGGKGPTEAVMGDVLHELQGPSTSGGHGSTSSTTSRPTWPLLAPAS